MRSSHLVLLPLLVLALATRALSHVGPQQDARRAELEAALEELLTGARLVGSFTDDSRPDAPPARDSYTIASAECLSDERWRFQATIEYRENDVTVPLELTVKWAGDTPVITLDELEIPGLGKFTARVLFHGRSYAGIWSGPGHGGQMFGRVVPAGEGGESDGERAGR